jgi:hypothetical protein
MCFPWRGLTRALLITASLSTLGGWSGLAIAQTSPDPSMLDTGEAKPDAKAKVKKKAAPKAQQPAAGTQAKGGKPGGDRQFGELEGWSPGKNPAGEKKPQDDSSGTEPKNGVSMSPSGKPSMGLSF